MEPACTQLGVKQGTLTWWGVTAAGLWPPPSSRGGLGLGAGVLLCRTCAGGSCLVLGSLGSCAGLLAVTRGSGLPTSARPVVVPSPVWAQVSFGRVAGQGLVVFSGRHAVVSFFLDMVVSLQCLGEDGAAKVVQGLGRCRQR